MDWTQLFNDFRQKYEHTYAFVTLEGHKEPELFWLELVEQTDKSPLLHFANEQTGEVILRYDASKSDIEFKFPPIGLIPFEGRTFMVRRKYDRQWKAGVNLSTLSIIDIYSRINGGVFGGNRVTFSSLNEAFKSRPTLSIKEGLALLKRKMSVPLSSEFAIGLPVTDDEKILLFYHSNPIGLVDVDARKILLKESAFKQEFEDFTNTIQGLDQYDLCF